MHRTRQAIKDALSKEKLEELAKRQERTIGEFLKEILDEAISAPAIPGHYAPPLLLDAREMLDEVLAEQRQKEDKTKCHGTEMEA